jgi:superfamily I DNA and RNA helicase
MTECFRNPQPIVETSFNVLYGTALETGRSIPTKDYGDIATLEKNGLIWLDNGRWRVKFAPRRGQPPMLTLTVDSERELKLLVARLALLIRDDRVRPQDILILTLSRDRANRIADAIEREQIRGIAGVQRAFKEKDSALCQPGCVTISTVHSAKGYDAFVVLLCSANEFRTDVKGRAYFYVACTRAIERLEVFAYESSGLVRELDRLLQEPRGKI